MKHINLCKHRGQQHMLPHINFITNKLMIPFLFLLQETCTNFQMYSLLIFLFLFKVRIISMMHLVPMQIRFFLLKKHPFIQTVRLN